MRRNSSRSLLAVAGAALAAVLLIAGGLLIWGSAYVHNTVQGQLAAQQITFPPASAFAHPKAGGEITPNMIPSVSQYAGQQLLSTVGHSPEIRSHIDVSHAVGWQSGKLFFSDEPLSSAVARINRYSATPIEVDPSVERIRIGGTFRAGDTTTFTEAVSTYFPVDVVRTEAGAIRMTARTGP